MQLPVSKVKRIVLVGGGHTHALVLRALAMNPIQDTQITVINPSSKAPYTGMLPGFIAGHYSRGDVEIDILRLSRAAQAELILDEAVSMDIAQKTVALRNRPPISFTCASINIGITSKLPSIPGFSAFGTPAKPLGEFAYSWKTYLKQLSNRTTRPDLAVIGGGVGGVELALNMVHRIRSEIKTPPNMTIIEKSATILSGTHPKTRSILLRQLEDAGIKIKTNSEVVKVTEHSVQLKNGADVPSHFTVGAAGATPYPWLLETGLSLTNGFINVDETLTTETDPAVFAAGDCAHFSSNPLPKAGVFAVRQAPVLLHNLRATLDGGSKRPFKPQKTYLKLVSLGPKEAVSDKFGLSLSGSFMWKWKDRIDRRFMNRLNEVSIMGETPSPNSDAPDMLCSGCGAKMDGTHLARVLQNAPPLMNPNIVSGPGDDAAILKHADGFQTLTTDHLRAVTKDPWLMGKIAANHALGDIWAMGATPQAALSSIILPPASDTIHADMLNQILSGAREILTAAGADLVGGHTSIGAELTIGFTLSGLSKGMPIANSGAKPGDKLILTKPIGTGTILAAEMRGRADGTTVEATYEAMIHSAKTAAQILRPHANAMTDVTGFGLLGHLMRMLGPEGLGATLHQDDIPTIPDAIELAQQGVRSSLWQSNRNALAGHDLPETPKTVLLFDPQTAGGLLASIPDAKLDQTMNALHDAGETAACIGTVTEQGTRISIQ